MPRASSVIGNSSADFRLRPNQQALQRRVVQATEHQHLTAGQQRAVQGKGRVFGGGTDQGDGAVLHNGQEAVLLRAIEAVNLIHEQQRTLPGSATFGGIVERPLEVGNA